MRRAARVDTNHADVIDALRGAGFAAHSTAQLGAGFPDILASCPGANVLFEVKDGSRPAWERKLTPPEREFFATWPGPCFIVYSAEEAVRIMLGFRK